MIGLSTDAHSPLGSGEVENFAETTFSAVQIDASPSSEHFTRIAVALCAVSFSENSDGKADAVFQEILTTKSAIPGLRADAGEAERRTFSTSPTI